MADEVLIDKISLNRVVLTGKMCDAVYMIYDLVNC